MFRAIPQLSEPQPTYSIEYQGQIRGWLETITSSNPYTQIDWNTYKTVLTFASQDGYRPIVEEVLKRRLSSTGAAASKVRKPRSVALAPSSLIGLIDQLKKHVTPPEDSPVSHTNIIAQSLLDMAEKQKKENEENDAKYKWDTWCDLYGKPTEGYEMPGLPKDIEWGMWGLVWVPQDEWWKIPPEEPEEKKE